jgi:hypothetical protein
MAQKKPSKPAARTSVRAMPEPPLGQGGQGQSLGPDTYPAPATGSYTLGLTTTSHNHSVYPQPNSANQPDTSSLASAAPVPGPEAYRPSLAGNALSPSVVNPMDIPDEPALPDYPS